MIEHGSIEVIRGVGNNSTSRGVDFDPEDEFNKDDVVGSVKRIAGVDITSSIDRTNPPSGLLGAWRGKDEDGATATVHVWVYGPG